MVYWTFHGNRNPNPPYTQVEIDYSASYRPGRHAATLDVNFNRPLAEASICPIERYGVWFPMQPSRLGSGLEAFSHNPSSGSITALQKAVRVGLFTH